MSWELYDLLLARAASQTALSRIVLGLNWSVAQGDGVGVCFSPADVARTLPWSGALRGQSASQLAPWLRSFDAAQACVGALAVNTAINRPDNPALVRAEPLAREGPGHLRVFAHFAPRLAGASIVVIGRYPGLFQLWSALPHTCLERKPGTDVLPDAAAEYLLPRADWVFITASAIANKTLPRLLQLSRQATVVLMGPSAPWLDEWADFGVDYLAGAAVHDVEALFQTAAEAGGTRVFETGLSYRLLQLR